MKLLVSTKNVYGQELLYPADGTATLFTRLTGRKTFTALDIAVIKRLGYEVQVAQEAVTL